MKSVFYEIWSSIPHCIPAGLCFRLGVSVARTPFSDALPMPFSFVRIASEDGLQHGYRLDQIQGLQSRSFQRLAHNMLLTCDHRISGPPLKVVHECEHVRRRCACVYLCSESFGSSQTREKESGRKQLCQTKPVMGVARGPGWRKYRCSGVGWGGVVVSLS